MNECRTCAHWAGPWNELDRPGRWGACHAIVDGWAEGGSERAYTSDASGAGASLFTREDFGCVEWRTKEQQ